MRMRALRLILLVVVAGVLGYFTFGLATARARGSVQDRALAAYKAGEYSKALPLLKEWAAIPEVRKSPDQLRTVMMYIVDTEKKLQPAPSAAPASGPTDLLAQAQAAAAVQAGGDPPMGADRVPQQAIKVGETREMTIKQMGNFEFDPDKDADVPADVKLLEGGHVRLNGFMMPLTQADKITDFALVPSLLGCCFGQPPGVQHIVTCRTPGNAAVYYYADEMVVEGMIHVRVKREDGYTYSIFELDVGSVQTKE